MAKIRLKQIDNSTANPSDVITYNGTNNVWAAPPGAGSGESNTASNVGVGGVGPFKQKTGVDLEFKNINAGSSKISITDDVANNEIDIDVVPGNILTSTLNNDANFAADQNLWETIDGDTGSTTANTITDTLTIAGTTDEIVTTVSADTVSVGIADNPILPGTGSVTVPTGTTAQQPGTPTLGMTRFNTTLNCLEFWEGTEWACLNTGETLQGASFTLMFAGDGIVNNTWLDHGANNVTTDDTFAILPFACELSALTFSNTKVNAQQDLELYSAAENTLAQTLELTWSLIARSGRKADFGVIAFEAGDKLGLYSRSGGESARDTVINLFFQVTAVNTDVSVDITPGTFVA